MKEFLSFLKWSFSPRRGGFVLCWNLLPKQDRYLGVRIDNYDGPLYSLSFWWWHIYIQEAGTIRMKEYMELVSAVIELCGDDPIHLLSKNPSIRSAAKTIQHRKRHEES